VSVPARSPAGAPGTTRTDAVRSAAAKAAAARMAAAAADRSSAAPAGPRTSARPGAARTGTRPEGRGTNRTRVLAPQARPGSRLPAVLASGVVMLATLMAVLLLNIALSRGSYADQTLTDRQTQLAEREQALREQLAASEAPGALDARARALGMVPAGDPGYLRLTDGTVLGKPEPATAPTPSATAPVEGSPASSPSASTPSAAPTTSPTATSSPSSTGAPSRAQPTPQPTPGAGGTRD
jgi:hypothetical protein